MVLSRSEAHQRQKQQRSKRLRRLVVLNIALLLIIGMFAVVYALQPHDANGHLDVSLDDKGGAAQGGGENGGSNGSQSPDGGKNHAGGTGQGGKSDTGDVNGASDGGSSPDPVGTDASGTDAGGTDASGTDASGTDASGTDAHQGSSGDGGVRLSFTGDILLAASVEKLMLKNGYDYPYAKVLPFLRSADVTAANLETPVTLRGTPAPNKQYVYKSSPDALPALLDSGIDLVNLANNHTLDQGEEGLLDTIDYLNKAKLPNIGAGRDDTEAFKPVVKEASGIRIAYLGLTRVVPVGSWKAEKNHPGLAETYDPTRAIAAIKQAKEQADIVVVMVHWGTELTDMPNADQTRLGHAYIDAGADLVIGSHPHVLQGVESYKGKWIAYSLGNFIFSGMPDKRTADTGVLDAKCDASGKCSLQLHPMRADQSQPAPLQGEEAEALLQRISGISIHAIIDSKGQVKAKE